MISKHAQNAGMYYTTCSIFSFPDFREVKLFVCRPDDMFLLLTLKTQYLEKIKSSHTIIKGKYAMISFLLQI